jgi:hypothetical protein
MYIPTTTLTVGGGAAIRTSSFRVDLQNPSSNDGGGNAFPRVEDMTTATYEQWMWAFAQDVDGYINGIVRVPENLAITPSAKIVVEISADPTTGVTRLVVSTKAIANGETMNPASFTVETAQDITVPATTKFRKKVTFNLTETIVAEDLLLVQIYHNGAHGNDTLADLTKLHGAWLVCDVT